MRCGAKTPAMRHFLKGMEHDGINGKRVLFGVLDDTGDVHDGDAAFGGWRDCLFAYKTFRNFS